MENLKAQYKPELYDRIKNNALNYAKTIIPELRDHGYKIDSVLDVGCGGAGFLAGCNDIKILDVFGVDGEHVKPSLQIRPEKFKAVNLEERLNLDRRFDLTVSLEVAEHLDEQFADIFIASLCSFSPIVLFSAAQVGQPGIHHVNCQSLEYWQDKFRTHGFILRHEITDSIRLLNTVYYLYRRNSMFFEKSK